MRLASIVVVAAAAGSAQPSLPPASTGDLLVSSSNNSRILRLDPLGNEIAALSLPGLAHPRGIVVAGNGVVFVVSQQTNEVLVLDRRLQVQRRFATGAVQGPTGAALGPAGNLFVAGFNSSNVGEFRPDGTPVRSFGGGGLRFANCVAFRDDGGCYVASAGTGQVVRFDAAGNPMSAFTGYGLSSPMGLAIWNDELFAAGGGSNNIVVFDLQGTPRREIRHPDISGPQGIAFTRDGLLVTSGYYNHKVSWFRPDGSHVRTVQPPTSSIPRSLAFLPAVELHASGNPTLGQPYRFTAASAFEPDAPFAAGLSLATSPGLVLPDGRVFPLAADSLFFTSLTAGPPIFSGFVGRLDSSGDAGLTLLLPVFAPLRGLDVHAAALTLDWRVPTLVRQISTAVTWRLQ